MNIWHHNKIKIDPICARVLLQQLNYTTFQNMWQVNRFLSTHRSVFTTNDKNLYSNSSLADESGDGVFIAEFVDNSLTDSNIFYFHFNLPFNLVWLNYISNTQISQQYQLILYVYQHEQ